ncbi:MAG: BON domain-containing protein [Planctomycetota bacterium]|nr:BON domain-containing protein [Planctomycetota bacterium]
MRRKYFGLAIAALAALGPSQVWGGDREIAEEIIKRLKSNRDSGALKDFTLDMKVDQGVVAFRGNVAEESQKQLVLGTAEGIEGVANVLDQVSVGMVEQAAAEEAKPEVTETKETAPQENSEFSFRKALLEQVSAESEANEAEAAVMPASSEEVEVDSAIVSGVITALTSAKEAGQLRGFGVDVKSQNGVVQLVGRASSEAQRNTIIALAEGVEGVTGVRQNISVPKAAPAMPKPVFAAQDVEANSLAPVAVDPVVRPARESAAPSVAVAAMPVASEEAPMTRTVANFAPAPGPVAGQPVPMAAVPAPGTPRYDTPNLPNYAWPGYAAHPNYAQVTYPTQYSPSAWPFIGPFYPYPQVPLGWRRVSLEWDDGWWFLDFSDR